jgi:hypothetical protein
MAAQPPSEPRQERPFLVQVLVGLEVQAPDRQEACALALAEVAHRCESGHGLHVRVEELR